MALGVRFQKLREESNYQGRGGGGVKFSERQGGASLRGGYILEGYHVFPQTCYFCETLLLVIPVTVYILISLISQIS